MEIEVNGEKIQIDLPEGYRIVRSKSAKRKITITEERKKQLSEAAKNRPREGGRFKKKEVQQ